MGQDRIYTYDAFISYRHTEPDKEIAERLHKLLETYKIPKSVIKVTGKKRINRVFRDRDELPTSSNLADNILIALESSEYLIVICSPRTPQSQWVLKEIEIFKKLHGPDKILALLIEGEPSESFPSQLLSADKIIHLDNGEAIESTVPVEPLAADIRASTPKEMYKKLKTEVLRLLSAMLNCRFDDLKQRHKERLIKTVLTISMSLSTFFLAFGSFSTYQALIINKKSIEINKKSEEIQQQSLEIAKKNEEITQQIKETRIGQSRYLADISNRYFKDGDRYRAILAALAALPKSMSNPDRPYVHEAEYALSKASAVYETDVYFDGDIVLDHDTAVNLIMFSPNKNILLTHTNDGFIYTWNTDDGSSLGKYYINIAYLNSDDIIFVGDNSIITRCTLTESYKDVLLCLDIFGNILWQIDDFATKLTYSKDKNLLVYYNYNNLCFVDASTGSSLLSIPFKELLYTDNDTSSYGKYVTSMTFDNNSQVVAIGTSIGKIFTFNTQTGEHINSFETKFKNISDLTYSKENYLAVLSNFYDEESLLLSKGKGCLEIFSLDMNRTELLFPNSSVNNALFCSDAPKMLVLLEHEKINVVNIETGSITKTFIHGDKVSDYQINGNFIVSSSYDGTIKFWVIDGIIDEAESFRITRPESIQNMVQGKGKLIFTTYNSGKVYLYTPIINENTKHLDGHNYTIRNAIFSSNKNLALTYSSRNGELFLWDVKDCKLLISKTYSDEIENVRFMDNDDIILVSFISGKLITIKTSDFSVVSEISANKYSPFFVNNSLNLIAIPSYDNITIYSIPDLKTVTSFNAKYAESCYITDNNQLFFVGRKVAGIKDIDKGRTVYNLGDPEINTGAISKDGKLFALSYNDNSIKLFEVGNFIEERIKLENLAVNAIKLIFSPDSRLLFVQFQDKSVNIFDTLNGGILKSFTKAEFITTMNEVKFSSDNSKFILMGSPYSNIIDAATFKIIATAHISDIDKDFTTIISYGGSTNVSNTAYVLPYYTTQMLIDEAHRQLKGRALTEEEKAYMFIN